MNLPTESHYEDFTQRKTVDALYQQWKKEQELEKARILAENLNMFFGDGSYSPTFEKKPKKEERKKRSNGDNSSGGLGDLIKRSFKRLKKSTSLASVSSSKLNLNEKSEEDIHEEIDAEANYNFNSNTLSSMENTPRSSIDHSRRNRRHGYLDDEYDFSTLGQKVTNITAMPP